MAQKPRPPTFEVLVAARIEQGQIAIADLYKLIGQLGEAVEQLEAQVAELLARPPPAHHAHEGFNPDDLPTEVPDDAPAPSAGPPRRRLLAGRWPLRDGNVYPRDTALPEQPPYEEGLALRSPPAMS